MNKCIWNYILIIKLLFLHFKYLFLYLKYLFIAICNWYSILFWLSIISNVIVFLCNVKSLAR
jgi:hypothetical protein